MPSLGTPHPRGTNHDEIGATRPLLPRQCRGELGLLNLHQQRQQEGWCMQSGCFMVCRFSEAVDRLGQLLAEAAFGKSYSWEKLPQKGP
uniref:Uncharacterized protein n=1 Tax=Oryza glaberrima TaxID=4538 RepID=I1Q2F9_ORYGL